jgi:hypothetical protein
MSVKWKNAFSDPLCVLQGKINPYFGVSPSCEHRILKKVSFRGQGHVEVKSQHLREHIARSL